MTKSVHTNIYDSGIIHKLQTSHYDPVDGRYYVTDPKTLKKFPEVPVKRPHGFEHFQFFKKYSTFGEFPEPIGFIDLLNCFPEYRLLVRKAGYLSKKKESPVAEQVKKLFPRWPKKLMPLVYSQIESGKRKKGRPSILTEIRFVDGGTAEAKIFTGYKDKRGDDPRLHFGTRKYPTLLRDFIIYKSLMGDGGGDFSRKLKKLRTWWKKYELHFLEKVWIEKNGKGFFEYRKAIPDLPNTDREIYAILRKFENIFGYEKKAGLGNERG